MQWKVVHFNHRTQDWDVDSKSFPFHLVPLPTPPAPPALPVPPTPPPSPVLSAHVAQENATLFEGYELFESFFSLSGDDEKPSRRHSVS